jgi:uracil permease
MTGIGLSALIGVILNLILPRTKEKNENKEEIGS